MARNQLVQIKVIGCYCCLIKSIVKKQSSSKHKHLPLFEKKSIQLSEEIG